MDLGNKTANNLLSKDFKVATKAAQDIVNNSDIKAFEALTSKSEFIFDYIKEKIVRNLTNSVNKDNILRLFDFMGVYESDFCGFILNPLVKFQNEEIKNKFHNLLINGSDSEKTYALEFFTKIKEESYTVFAKENIKSAFYPLKNASIKFLANLSAKEEFNSNLEILKNGKDEFEKIEAVEFLTIYGDKFAFEPIYNCFSTAMDENIAQNLLFLKNFKELIEEGKENVVLNLYSAILRAFPDNINFQEINFYLQDGILDFLFESENNFSALLNFYLESKVDLILNNEAYSIDLSNEEKKEALALSNKLSMMVECFNLDETVTKSLNSKERNENLIALEIIKEQKEAYMEPVKNLCLKTNDNETILECLKAIKSHNKLEQAFVDEILNKVENETVKAEIKNL